MPLESHLNAKDIQSAVEELENASRKVADLMAGFDQSSSETELVREINNDLDRALAKLRFFFTTVASAGQTIRTELECEWGECPMP
ncbi:MAG: hypothetical protein ACOWWM_17255 [Desulfobacterales bacterium]